MGRIQLPDPGGGGGGTPPSQQEQAIEASRARRAVSQAERHVEVHGKDGKAIIGVGPVSFQGDGVSEPTYDSDERQVVVTIPGTDADAIHASVSGEIAAITLKASPVSADVLLIEDSAASNAKKRVPWSALPGSGGGEANTGSNQGTDGVGVYDTKVGVDLQFRHVAPASSKVTVVLNGKDIDLDVAEANLTHDNLSGGTSGAPHSGHEATANKGAANGYAGLGAGGYVPTGQLGSGTPDATKFLRGDQSWAAPGGGGVNQVIGPSGVALLVAKGLTGYIGSVGVSATESEVQLRLPACTVKRLRANVSANGTGADGSTVTVRKNGADTSVTVTYNTGETGVKSDDTNTSSFTGGDLLSIGVVNAGSGGGTKDLTLASVTVELEAA